MANCCRQMKSASLAIMPSIFKKHFLILLLVSSSIWCCFGQQATGQLVADFMGTNTNVAAYDNGYLEDLSKCVKWIREYHSWAHYEAANDFYKWDDVTQNPHTYTWPHHTKFMESCRELGLAVLIDALNKPQWAGSSPVPNTSGDGESANDYLEKLEFLGQLVARYGSKTLDDNVLKTADKISGLNYIQYYEDENEPDYWWKTPVWPAENYAQYCNAAHDGTGVQATPEFPLLGIKSVDPEAKHVLAGMAGPDTTYFYELLAASDGRIPFDVLNVHMYCTDQSNAYSPEHENYGYEKGFEDFFKWKDRALPEMPVWITEFGWDTYKAPDGQHSYTYASFEQQANYLMRSYFIFLKMEFEKAFMFMAADVNSENTLQYSSSGLIRDKNSGFAKKPSYYYLATMQNVLGELMYNRTVAYGEEFGNNEVYCLEFEHPGNEDKVYALWVRETGSDNDNGANTVYQLNLEAVPSSAFSILPKDLDADGDTASVELNGTVVDLNLTETPLFVVAKGLETGFEEKISEAPVLKAYPNPARGTINLEVQLSSRSVIELAVYSSEGQLVKILQPEKMVEKEAFYRFGDDFKSGSYYIRCRSQWGTEVERIVILK